jgi:hypothetical protein
MSVGPFLGADGTSGAPGGRFGKTGESIVAQAHGKYFEAAHRGNLYAAGIADGGAAPGTATGTTGFLILENPKGSGKRLAIKKVSVGYVSGTIGAGTLWHCLNNNPTAAAVSGGTAITPTNLDSNTGNSSVAKPNTGGTLPATPSKLWPLGSWGAEAAATALSGPAPTSEDVDGAIVLEPGTQYSLQGEMAAGTTPKLTAGIVWEEIPIV